jgi:hypothetical protein
VQKTHDVEDVACSVELPFCATLYVDNGRRNMQQYNRLCLQLSSLLTFICCCKTHGTVIIVKLTVVELDKKFPAFYEAGRFVTVFTTARQLSLS